MKSAHKYLRILFSVALVYLLLRWIDLQDVILVLRESKLWYLVSIIVILACEKLIEAYKWNLLLRAKKIYIPFMEIFKITYIGSFLGFALPSAVSVDFMRGYGLYRRLTEKEESISSVIVDRVLALASLIVLALLSSFLFLILSVNKDMAPKIYSIVIVLLILIGLLLIATVPNHSLVMRIIGKHCAGNNVLVKRLKKLHDSLQGYKVYRKTLLRVISLSGVIHTSRILVFFLASLCLGLEVPVIYFFIFIPIVLLMTRLPISIGGIGVREGSFIYFFAGMGYSSSEAFAVPFLISIFALISIVPGGIIYAAKGL